MIKLDELDMGWYIGRIIFDNGTMGAWRPIEIFKDPDGRLFVNQQHTGSHDIRHVEWHSKITLPANDPKYVSIVQN